MAETPDFAKPREARIEPYSPRTADRVSDSTRALLAGIAGKTVEKPAEAAPPEPDEVEEDAPVDVEPTEQPPAAPAEPRPPAPPLDADRRKLEARAAQLDAIEREWEERYKPRVKVLEEVAAKLVDDPAAAFRQLAMSELGLDEAQAADLVNQIGEDWARQQIGAEIEPEKQAIRDTAKLRREMLAHKRQTRAAEEEKARAAKEREHQQAVTEAVTSLGQELSRQADAYPFLHDQPEAGRIVWDVINRDYQRKVEAGQADAEPLSFDAAAKLANTYYQKHAEELVQRAERYRPLLAPAQQSEQPRGASPTTAGASENKSKSQPTRQPRTLTNAHATETAPPEPEPQFANDTERKRYFLRKHIGALRDS